MKSIKFKKSICAYLFIFLSVYLSTAQTDKDLVAELANKYLSLYTQVKFDEMSSYYNESSVFEDPTTSFFDPQKSYQVKTGAKNIVAYLKEGFRNVTEVNYEIEKQYTVGVIHFTYGVLNYKYAVNVEGTMKPMDFSMPMAIILTIKNNKVVHHQDIADYNVWIKQYNNQLKN